MCGIAGKFHFRDRQPVSPELIERMNTVQAHRGPDGSGTYFDRGLGLGHRRLSIIDVAGGHQPLANEDETVWIVFNGEIYNFPELRERLIAKGHRFRTHSDTEAIVHLYEERGADCVEELRGMFAFAIWDRRRETLLLARDRLGIKPLHYAVLADSALIFGSEIKALLQDPAVPRQLDPAALNQYLSLLYVPAPATMFAGIRKLPPGHTLTCDRHGVRLRAYWDLQYRPNFALTETEAADQLADLLRETVRSHLLADVPLGAFLSGGVDSSTIVAFLRQVVTGPLVTLSVGFQEADYDELPAARLMARHVQSQHHEEVVAPQITGLLPRIVSSFDEPFADSSAVPTFYVSQAARRHVTVALSGDGGDELFAGYRRHRAEAWEQRWRRRLGPLRHLGGIARPLPERFQFKGRYSLECLAADCAEAYARKHSNYVMTLAAKRDLLDGAHLGDGLEEYRRLYREAPVPAADWLDRALYVDTKTYLPDDILTKVDRMSMAVSLETRPPLLDHKVVEFVATLPPQFKLRGRQSKHLLRQTAARWVPEPILQRPKQGFRLPVAEWLRGPLQEMARDVLLGPTATRRGYFRMATIQRWMQQHQSGRRDHAHRLWLLLMFELWHRQYLDTPLAASPR